MMKKKYKIFAFAVFFTLFFLASPACAYSEEDYSANLEYKKQKCEFFDVKMGEHTTFMIKCAKSRNTVTTKHENDEAQTLPEEYNGFIESLPDSVVDKLPDVAFSNDVTSLESTATEVGGISYLLRVTIDAFSGTLAELLPTLSVLCGIVVLSSVAHTFASNVSAGLAGAVGFATRLCSFCAISSVAMSAVSRLEAYFNGLLGAVSSFLPLSGVLYAMGGNLSGAATGTATLSATLTVCEFFLNKTVLPVFCLCLSLTLLQAFEGVGAFSGQSVAATVKKWYTTALAFVMMILTTAIAAQNVLAVKADGAAMRGMKFAANSFIPVSGGALSSTLGTLAASVELIRGSVGVVGVAVILLMLIPVIAELALLRGIFGITSFMAGVLGCGGEQKLLSEIGSLYGYLEGIAALSSAVFIIAFGIFASTATAI